MNRTHVAFLISIITAGILTSSQDVLADGFGNAYWWRGHYPIVDWSSAYQAGKIPVPPYYALHPPVYYGTSVRRPYGYSPFTNYPPYQPTRLLSFAEPEETVMPQWVENPHYVATLKVSPQPQVVLNPYVTSPPSNQQVTYVSD